MSTQTKKLRPGPKVGPEGPQVAYPICVPPSLKAWLQAKGPKFVKNHLNKLKEGTV